MKKINELKFRVFLVDAKTNTYASDKKDLDRTLEDGSKELVYENGIYRYKDRYFGRTSFHGQEIAFINDKPVWSMCYFGRSNYKDPAELGKFLKFALRHVTEEKPFRGPVEIEDGNLRYVNINTGALWNFSGVEKIFHKNNGSSDGIYRLDYFGGAII